MGTSTRRLARLLEVLVKLHGLVAPDDLLPPMERFEGAAKRIQTNNWLTLMTETF